MDTTTNTAAIVSAIARVKDEGGYLAVNVRQVLAVAHGDTPASVFNQTFDDGIPTDVRTLITQAENDGVTVIDVSHAPEEGRQSLNLLLSLMGLPDPDMPKIIDSFGEAAEDAGGEFYNPQ